MATTTTLTFEQQVLQLTNEERAKYGLAALKDNAELDYAADKYAESMAKEKFFSHTGLDGSQPWDRAKKVGFEAQTMGENIALGQKTPADVVAAWMNSSGHRANILNPNFTELGVGFQDNYWVQDFGSNDTNPASYIPTSGSQPSPTPTPTPTPTTGKEIKGGDGNDVLTGSAGNDVIWGGKGNDTLNGGDGSDRLIGGLGRDKLTGGAGGDTFVYQSLQDRGDTITDFAVNQDKIDVRQILGGQTYTSNNKFSDFLKFQQFGANTIVSLDVNGNTKPGGFENFILLEKVNASSLTASNFII